MAETTKYKIYYLDDDNPGYQKMADMPLYDRQQAESIETALSNIDLTDKKGEPDGIAELDENGKIPSSQLPSYADDVIVGYYYENIFYEDSEHTTEITGEVGKIYVDLTGNKLYRFEENENTGIYLDLTDYVKNTDYATVDTGGVIKANSYYALGMYQGNIFAQTKTNEQYSTAENGIFISKGTLDNVLNARIGDINSLLDEINGEII